MNRRLQFAILALVAAVPANAYYFWTQYQSGSSPYNPAPQKFDITALPNSTVTFYATDTGPSQYTGNDSFAAVLSQIRQAAAAWNAVSTSSLRVAFGGTFTSGTPQTTPGGQIVFVQLPPGILGYGGVSSKADISTSPTKSFYPILTSFMYLTTNLTQSPGPSYTDFFFLNVVHEMGHALGLQHTFTSSAMSQATTRTTVMTRIVDADDVAGISVLYPAPNFASQFGSITGRVQFSSGQPVHLASVVAIRAGGSGVSAFTNPDGTYQVNGISPGSYFVYVDPIPPTGDVMSPLDPKGNPVAPSGPFSTSWYPGTNTFSSAVPLQVSAGGVTPNINFSVSPLPADPLYDVQAYSYINGNYVAPAYVNENAPEGTATAFGGVGLGSGGVITPGLTSQILGGAATIYASTGFTDSAGDTYYAMYMYFTLGNSTGPQHVIFSLPNYTYVLSNAVNLTLTNPPTISSILPDPDGSVSITGANFASDTRFFFDGSPLPVRSIDTVNQIAVAIPPPGASGQHATAMALNDDGQNSFFAQASSPATYAYPAAPAPNLTLNPATLPAGVEAMVDITGVNTNFVQGQTSVGFGSSDIYVRQVFVLTPNHLQCDVFIPANAAITPTEVDVTTGFQSAIAPAAFQITANNPRLPVTSPLVTNTVAGQTAIYPGATVNIFGSNLSSGGTPPTVTFNNLPAQVELTSPTQITVQIPAGLTTGPATMALTNSLGAAYPVDVTVSAVPTGIAGVLNATGASNDVNHPAHAGDVVAILIANFADPSASIAPSRVQVSVSTASTPALIVAPYGTNLFEIQMNVPSVPSGSQPIAVYLDGKIAAQGTIFIQ